MTNATLEPPATTPSPSTTTQQRQRTYFDITINNTHAGRIVFELFTDQLPKTTRNFIELCRGGQTSQTTGVNLSYTGCSFHRVISGFMIQGGDFTRGDGTGGESIYGEKFEDEAFPVKHTRAGLLSMANAGPNTNGSQFFITLRDTAHLDGKHVVFGRVLKGMSLVRRIENLEMDQNDRPKVPVTISASGVLAEGEAINMPTPGDGDNYPDCPEDHDLEAEDHPKEFIQFATEIKALGNAILKKALAVVASDKIEAEKLFQTAVEKYDKAVQYLDAINPSPEDVAELEQQAKSDYFAIKVSSLSNQSLAYTKIGRWSDVKAVNEKILSIADKLALYTAAHPDRTPRLAVSDADRAKATFRIGQALYQMRLLDAARPVLERAREMLPDDALVAQTLDLVTKSIKQREVQEKKMYQKMFA